MGLADRLSDLIRHCRSDEPRRTRLARIAVALTLLWVACGTVAADLRAPIDRGAVAAAAAMLRTAPGDGVADRAPATSTAGLPLALRALATVSPALRDRLTCRGDGCATIRTPAAVVGVQAALAVGGVLLALLLAWRLSGSWPIAVVTMLLVVSITRQGEPGGVIRGHAWHGVLLFGLALLLVETIRRRSFSLAAAAGAVLALDALFEPIVLLLVPAIGGLVAALWPRDVRHRAAGLLAAAAFVLAACIVQLAALRGAVAAGYDTAGTVHHVGAALGQRLAYLGLERRTWLAGIALHIPMLGEIVSGVLSTADLRRHAAGGAGSFVADGETIWRTALANRGGDGLAALRALFADGIVARPLAWLGSTPPVLARGLLAGGGIVALLGLFHLRRMLAFARIDDRLGIHLMLLVPAAALLLANALLTGNAWWLGPLLPFVYAYAIAYVAAGW